MRWNVVGDAGLILRMAAKGRTPPLLPRAIPRIEEVRSLYRLAEEMKHK